MASTNTRAIAQSVTRGHAVNVVSYFVGMFLLFGSAYTADWLPYMALAIVWQALLVQNR
jgi:hypothetical protein